MSEIDIELQKQTSDVSITEMLKELDSIKLQQLGDNDKEQNQIGE